MLKMRHEGVRIPRARLYDRHSFRHRGLCVVIEGQDFSTRRTMTLARFARTPDATGGEVLYDARLVWMNEDGRFLLTGFERVQRQGNEVEFAQSWLIFPKDDAPPLPEGR